MADPKQTKKTVKKAPAQAAPVSPDEEVWSIPFPEGEDPDLTGGGFPVGSCLLRCIEKPKQTLTQKQDPQIEFQMEGIDPNHPDLMGRQARIYCSLKPKAWWFLINVLEAMGVDHNVSVEERKLDFNPNDCVGGTLIGIFEENDQRPGRTRINGVLPPDDSVENISDEGGAEEAGEPTFDCPECGKPVPESADKCPHCGVEFE